MRHFELLASIIKILISEFAEIQAKKIIFNGRDGWGRKEQAGIGNGSWPGKLRQVIISLKN